MPGPAIRAWHLSLELAAAGHEVVLLGTLGATRRHPAMTVESTDDPARIAERLEWCDAVFATTSVAARYPFVAASAKPLCIDMYIPTHLENLEPSGAPAGSPEHVAAVGHQVRVLNADLRTGDFFVCASERQRDFWLGAMGALGRLNPATYGPDPTLRSLIDVVPFGLDPAPARPAEDLLRKAFPAIGPDDDVLVWGGGVYNWFDPLSLVRAVDRLRSSRPHLRLVFLGMANPNPSTETRMVSELRDLSGRLGLVGTHVFFNEGWVPYAERAGYLVGATAGVSTHFGHVEAHFSFRTRVLDYLWAGLPGVLTAGDALSDALSAAGLAVSVAPEDVDGIAEGIDRLLASPPPREEVLAFAEAYQWPRVARPLVRWAADPRRAPDLAAEPGLEAETAAPVAAPAAPAPESGAGGWPAWVGRLARTRPGRRLRRLGRRAGGW